MMTMAALDDSVEQLATKETECQLNHLASNMYDSVSRTSKAYNIKVRMKINSSQTS